ncbi:ubiB [Symbiodinium sp. CCMP2456]|nr:ubiB [Symbiodinium sp. CCMP2456]
MSLWLCLLLALGAAFLYVVVRVLVRQRRPCAKLSELRAVAAALAQKQCISIVGCCCTGKSTLAHTLAKIKGVRHIELDSLAWLPGWQNRDREEFKAMLSQQIQEAKAQGGFTIDGNYFNATGGFVWDEVEVVVWLDLDFWVVLTRAVWRTLKRMICRIECCNGNYEHPGLLFTGDSVITWVIKVHHLQEEKLRRMREKHQHQPLFVRIRCPQDVDRLVQLVRLEVGL